jgi:glycosyltransferase involved in cell wall biosynthesis
MSDRVGYFSSYDRGLECLLAMWPDIRAAVPGATLDIYYGWNTWDALHGDRRMDFKDRILAALDDLEAHGVREHGRVSHEELASAMRAIDVWAYPTQWQETFCITALKAQEAGCWPVVTAVGALPESVVQGDLIDCRSIYSDRPAQQEFVGAVVTALREGKRALPVPGTDWADVARAWVAQIDAFG